MTDLQKIKTEVTSCLLEHSTDYKFKNITSSVPLFCNGMFFEKLKLLNNWISLPSIIIGESVLYHGRVVVEGQRFEVYCARNIETEACYYSLEDAILSCKKHKYQKLFKTGNKAQFEKLEENEKVKNGWDNIDIAYAIGRLKQEIEELKLVDLNDFRKLREEAADIANFAHMIIFKCKDII